MMKDYLKKNYYIISTIFVISVLLNQFDWQFAGYLTEKIIAWVWIFSTLIFISVFWKSKWTKAYLGSLIGLIILSLLPMAIPFFGMINYLTSHEYDQQLSINDQYRMERTRHQPLSMPRVYIYEKKLKILEKNVCRPVYAEVVAQVLNLKNDDDLHSANLKRLPIQNVKFISANHDSIGIQYQINNIKKVIYHRLNNQDGY